MKRIHVEKRENPIINRLNKTKTEKYPDLREEKEARLKELGRRDRDAQQAKVSQSASSFAPIVTPSSCIGNKPSSLPQSRSHKYAQVLTADFRSVRKKLALPRSARSWPGEEIMPTTIS